MEDKNTQTVDAEVVDEITDKHKRSHTMESAATGCSCSSCCLTGCLIPILIVILIWIGCILAKIARGYNKSSEPQIEQVQPNEQQPGK